MVVVVVVTAIVRRVVKGGTRVWKLGVQSNKNYINELNSVI